MSVMRRRKHRCAPAVKAARGEVVPTFSGGTAFEDCGADRIGVVALAGDEPAEVAACRFDQCRRHLMSQALPGEQDAGPADLVGQSVQLAGVAESPRSRGGDRGAPSFMGAILEARRAGTLDEDDRSFEQGGVKKGIEDMTGKIVILAASTGLVLAPTAVDAKGCLKGAVVGGVAGHYAHHHAIAGAMAGCVAGHYMAKRHAWQKAAAHS
jgi:hypothetical protein